MPKGAPAALLQAFLRRTRGVYGVLWFTQLIWQTARAWISVRFQDCGHR